MIENASDQICLRLQILVRRAISDQGVSDEYLNLFHAEVFSAAELDQIRTQALEKLACDAYASPPRSDQ